MSQDWEKFGNDIRTIVDNAVNSQNFSDLNKSISNVVNEAADSLQKGMRMAGHVVNQAAEKKSRSFYSTFQNAFDYNAAKNQEKKNQLMVADITRKDLFLKKTSLKAGGLALAICGCVLNIGLGFAVAILFLVSVFWGNMPLGIKIALSILLPFFAGSAVMTWKGSSMVSSVKRYRNYISGLKGRNYCNIKELASQSGKSVHFVIKDLRKMIDKGWFRQGHFNHDKTCLIVSHETFREYEELERQKAEQQRIQSQETSADETMDKLGQVICEGEQYLKKIQYCSYDTPFVTAVISSNWSFPSALPGQAWSQAPKYLRIREISAKISHMELLIRKIFDRVKEDPNSLESISKLMDYYLPTTVKLLEAYQQLCRQPVQGDNIRNSKLEIEQALDTLNHAFEQILDHLFEDVAWDVPLSLPTGAFHQPFLGKHGLKHRNI